LFPSFFFSFSFFLRICTLKPCLLVYLSSQEWLLFLTHNSFNILVCHFYFNIPLKFSRINYLPLQKFFIPPVPYFHHGTLLCIFHFLSFAPTSTAGDILFLTQNFRSFQESSRFCTWTVFVDEQCNGKVTLQVLHQIQQVIFTGMTIKWLVLAIVTVLLNKNHQSF
jgi:hypothetical protein